MIDTDLLRSILDDYVHEVTDLIRGLHKESQPVPEPDVEVAPVVVSPAPVVEPVSPPLAKAAPTPTKGLTSRGLQELISHEAIVQEAYKDSKGVWTWGIGVTSASGHDVLRYKDNPQTISKVIEIFKWLVEKKYLPAVLKAFDRDLTENQLAAALSFHYNTGAIASASWVKDFNVGDIKKARTDFMLWAKPKVLVDRRTKERDLFFDGKWSSNGKTALYPVLKPSYRPDYNHCKEVDIREDL